MTRTPADAPLTPQRLRPCAKQMPVWQIFHRKDDRFLQPKEREFRSGEGMAGSSTGFGVGFFDVDHRFWDNRCLSHTHVID